MKTIRIRTDDIVKEATLNDSEAAEAIWQALPLKSVAEQSSEWRRQPIAY